MGRKLSSEFVFKVLSTKGILFNRVSNEAITIDLANAKDLGNRSWGYIDFLVSTGMSVINRADYNKKNFSSKDKEDKSPKKRTVVKIKEEGKLHSYDGLLPKYDYKGAKLYCSEYTHMLELNHFQTKFNRAVFAKPDLERKAMNKARMVSNRTMPFTNKTVVQWSSDNVSPTDIINKDQYGR